MKVGGRTRSGVQSESEVVKGTGAAKSSLPERAPKLAPPCWSLKVSKRETLDVLRRYTEGIY